MSRPAPPRYPIASVENALRLLEMVAEQGSVTVADASIQLGVAPSTAHRLLAMLVHHGFVSRDSDRKSYLAGTALLDLGLAAARHSDLRLHVRPFLERVVAEVGETAHLVVRRGSSVVFIDCVECDRALRAGSRTGTMLPIHATASGKAILSALPANDVEQVVRGRLRSLTPRTIRSLDQLSADVEKTRRRGYAINLGESEEQLNAVAVACTLADQPPVAITVAGPSFRLREARLPEVARRLNRIVAELSMGASLAATGVAT